LLQEVEMLTLPTRRTAARGRLGVPSAAGRLLDAADARLRRLSVPTALLLPDGARLGAAAPRVTLRLHDARVLMLLLRGRIGALAQAHVDGRLDIDGALREVCAVVAELLPGDPVASASPQGLARWWSPLLRAGRSRARHHSARDREQVAFHYDLSNDFYALWLDPRRVYSCAYWPAGVTTLAAAQEAKLELICRKLMLRPGERLLDVGAGWGGLLLWAAQQHGVRAHGITLSSAQHAHVQRLIAERGLQGRVTVALCDYRDLPEDQPYDKIASVGMFEHVGLARLADYFAKLRRLLRPGGLLLNHGITAAGLHNFGLGVGIGDFVEQHIFPGGELVHVSQVLAALAEAGLEGLDVENLRPHYARTLWAWSDALEAERDAARAFTSERTLRAYRLYLAGSAMGFERGWMALHQVLAARPSGRVEDGALRGAQSLYPFQRDHVYRG
jgi:cyclopropane-fatty-acyl-phospholipid synthase